MPLGLSDIPLLGADIFNARSAAEQEAEKRQREEEERRQARRRESLEMAILELNRENLSTQRERRREELRRIREGLPPTPPTPGRGGTPAAPVIGLGVREEGPESFSEFMRREAAREEAQHTRELEHQRRLAGIPTRSQRNRPAEGARLTEQQNMARTVVNNFLSQQPLAEVDETVESALNPENVQSYPLRIRQLIEAGTINEVHIRDAWQRARGNVNLSDAKSQAIIAEIEELCAIGRSPNEIVAHLMQNPNAVDSRGDLEFFYENLIFSRCQNGG